MLASTRSGAAYSGTETKLTTAAFSRRAGEGLAIFYSGPVAMEEDAEAIFYDRGTFKGLLQDVLAHYSGTLDLTPQAGEIARAEIGGRIYALKEGEIVEVRYNSPQDNG
jgi:hypothetical protein